MKPRRVAGTALALVLVLGLAACESSTSESPDTTVVPGGGGNGGGGGLSVAYKLAAIHGDLSTEPEFQAIVDCIGASGIKGAETEKKIGDTLVASWEASGKQDSLLDWARAFC